MAKKPEADLDKHFGGTEREQRPVQMAQSGRSGSEKVRLCYPDRTAECGQIHADEPSHRLEDRHHV